ncbi:MAG: hypothetical protein IPG84_19890 [Betaproteobacteria bacterium]|nr:hypothetical protein [Betaproteobacteria bacterium]
MRTNGLPRASKVVVQTLPAERVGERHHVAVSIVVVDAREAEPVAYDLARDAGIARVGHDPAVRVGRRHEPALGVAVVAERAVARRVVRLDQVVGAIVAIGRHPARRVGPAREVAVAVVRVRRHVAQRVDDLHDATLRVAGEGHALPRRVRDPAGTERERVAVRIHDLRHAIDAMDVEDGPVVRRVAEALGVVVLKRRIVDEYRLRAAVEDQQVAIPEDL